MPEELEYFSMNIGQASATQISDGSEVIKSIICNLQPHRKLRYAALCIFPFQQGERIRKRAFDSWRNGVGWLEDMYSYVFAANVVERKAVHHVTDYDDWRRAVRGYGPSRAELRMKPRWIL